MRYLVIILTLSFSCAKRGTRSSLFTFKSMQIGNGSLPGGVFISGSNGTSHIEFGTAKTTGSSIIIPHGLWHFVALGYTGNSKREAMTGDMLCEDMSVDVKGKSMTVHLSFSAEKCDAQEFSEAAALAVSNQMRPLRFASCNNLEGMTDGDKTCEEKLTDIGEGSSFRFSYRGGGLTPKAHLALLHKII